MSLCGVSGDFGIVFVVVRMVQKKKKPHVDQVDRTSNDVEGKKKVVDFDFKDMSFFLSVSKPCFVVFFLFMIVFANVES